MVLVSQRWILHGNTSVTIHGLIINETFFLLSYYELVNALKPLTLKESLSQTGTFHYHFVLSLIPSHEGKRYHLVNHLHQLPMDPALDDLEEV